MTCGQLTDLFIVFCSCKMPPVSVSTGVCMTRDEHLQWAKSRALDYLDAGDINGALTSMFSDLNKHDETRDHPAIALGVMLMAGGHLCDRDAVYDHIVGYN